AGLGLVRLAESAFTALAYYVAGMFSTESAGLLPYILPSLVIGIPIGVRVIRHVRPETFRRVCMSFDAWVVGFGISTLLQPRHPELVDEAGLAGEGQGRGQSGRARVGDDGRRERPPYPRSLVVRPHRESRDLGQLALVDLQRRAADHGSAGPPPPPLRNHVLL